MTCTGGSLECCASQLQAWKPFAGAGEGSASGIGEVGSCGGGGAVAGSYGERLQPEGQIGVAVRSVSCPSLQVHSNADAGSEFWTDNDGIVGYGFCGGLKAREADRTVLGSCEAVRSNGYFRGKCHEVGKWAGTECELSVGFHGLNPEQNVAREKVPSSLTPFFAGQSFCMDSRKRIGSWSKRRKQLSHAFRRGLWRWREGYHARKRRKRATVGGSSSCSGRSWASDPATVGASPGCARSVTGTDSSGELFYGGVGSRSLWGMLSPSRIGLGSGSSSTRSDVRDPAGEACVYLVNTGTPSTVVGYDSEPDYSADGELNFADECPADEDDDEREPLHLLVWKKMLSKTSTCCAREQPDSLEEHMLKLIPLRESRTRRVHLPSMRHGRRHRRKMAAHVNRCLLDLNVS